MTNMLAVNHKISIMHLKSHQYEFAKDIENEVCICP